jgi:hypothetical protein
MELWQKVICSTIKVEKNKTGIFWEFMKVITVLEMGWHVNVKITSSPHALKVCGSNPALDNRTTSFIFIIKMSEYN